MKSRYKPTRRALLFWTLFIGIGAVCGAVGMLADPTGRAMGMDAMLPCFQKLPLADVLYRDYVFPGIALLVVNGLTNLTAAGRLLARKKAGILLGGCFGVTWVFHLASPVRAFCQAAEGDIREADYILVHHQEKPYWSAAREMDRLLGLKDSPAVSVCCREGRYRSRQRNNQIPLEMYCESPRD